MATLEASLSLTDNMTRVFRSISDSMDGVIDLFETLDRKTQDPLNNAKLVEAKRRIGEMKTTFHYVGEEIDDAKQKQNRFTDAIKKSDTASDKLLGTLRNVAGAIGLGMMVNSALETSSAMTSTEARLNLINDGLQSTDELSQKIMESANRSRASYLDTADAVAKLVQQTDGLFATNDDAIAFSETLNKIFTISGTSVEGKSSVMLQLTQALSSGVLRGEEFNAVLENAQPLVQMIADEMGVSVGQMRELAGEGKITGDIIKNAIVNNIDEVNEQFESMPMTFADVKTKISNMAMGMLDPLWEELESFFNSSDMEQFMEAISQGLKVIADIAVVVVKILSLVSSVVLDNWSLFGPVIYGIVGALTAYYIAVGIAKTATILLTIAKSTLGIVAGVLSGAYAILTGAKWADVTATVAETMATYGLATAVYTLLAPFILVIGIIVILIGVFYLAVWAVNYFTGSSISATGMIVGAFYWLYATIWNILASIWNFALTCAESMANGALDALARVKQGLGNFATGALGIVKSIANGINNIVSAIVKGIASMVNGAIDMLNGMISAYNSTAGHVFGDIGKISKVEMSAVMDTSKVDSAIASVQSWASTPLEQGHVDLSQYKAELKDAGEYYDKGYDIGAGFEDKVKDFFTFDSLSEDVQKEIDELMKATEGLDKGLTDGGMGDDGTGSGGSGGSSGYGDSDELGGIGDDVGAIRDSLGATEEDLKYLIDIAKKKATESFTSVNINIPIDMKNNVGNSSDLTGIVDYMTEQLTTKIGEAIESSAQGVHN